MSNDYISALKKSLEDEATSKSGYYRHGYAAASARCLQIIKQAVAVIEFYANGRENGAISGVEYDSDSENDVKIGKKAKEFLAKIKGEKQEQK